MYKPNADNILHIILDFARNITSNDSIAGNGDCNGFSYFIQQQQQQQWNGSYCHSKLLGKYQIVDGYRTVYGEWDQSEKVKKI